jgi:hypothetical protein
VTGDDGSKSPAAPRQSKDLFAGREHLVPVKDVGRRFSVKGSKAIPSSHVVTY